MGFNIFTRQLAADTQSPSAAGRGVKTGYVQQQAHREFAASAGSDEEPEIKSAAYTQQGEGLHKS
jgi:hypothetical protein